MDSKPELIPCPYVPHHKVRPDRLEAHITKCQWDHTDKGFVICPFNFKHHMPKSEYENHALNCPDRPKTDNSKIIQDPDEEEQDAVMMYLTKKLAKNQLSEQEMFPLGVMEGDFGGAKYSRGRGSWRRPRK